jgi:hypothetical protein
VEYKEEDLVSGAIYLVNNYQYEEDLNNEKREIKMLDPKYLAEFVNIYSNLISR